MLISAADVFRLNANKYKKLDLAVGVSFFEICNKVGLFSFLDFRSQLTKPMTHLHQLLWSSVPSIVVNVCL